MKTVRWPAVWKEFNRLYKEREQKTLRGVSWATQRRWIEASVNAQLDRKK